MTARPLGDQLPPVIDDPEQATVEWVGDALHSAGVHGVVHAVVARPIGTGQMSGTYLLEITGDAVPSRLVLKLASGSAATRAAGRAGYRAEVEFYADLAPSLTIRVPRCYLAIAADEYTRFSLLLEDASPAVQGDQIAGADAGIVTAAAVNLAGLHASTWCDESLWSRPWATPVDDARVRFLTDLYERSSVKFAAHFAGRLDPVWLDTLQSMGDEVAAFLSSSNGRFAAIHGDYRLDNLLIGPDREVIAVDWQTLAVGRPGRDLAYLIATSMPAATRRVSERSIIEAYHSALCAGGVGDCSLDDCVDEYVFGLVHPLFIIVVGCAMSEATERGDRMFTAMTERVMAAVDDHGRLRR